MTSLFCKSHCRELLHSLKCSGGLTDPRTPDHHNHELIVRTFLLTLHFNVSVLDSPPLAPLQMTVLPFFPPHGSMTPLLPSLSSGSSPHVIEIMTFFHFKNLTLTINPTIGSLLFNQQCRDLHQAEQGMYMLSCDHCFSSPALHL